MGMFPSAKSVHRVSLTAGPFDELFLEGNYLSSKISQDQDGFILNTLECPATVSTKSLLVKIREATYNGRFPDMSGASPLTGWRGQADGI